MKRSLLIIGMLLMMNNAEAKCICECVNGERVSVCNNNYEIRKACSANACEINEGIFVEGFFVKK